MFGWVGLLKRLLQLLQFIKQQQQQHLTSLVRIVNSNVNMSPSTAVPVTVSHPHHDQEENKAEEDEAGHAVDNGRGDGDRDRRHAGFLGHMPGWLCVGRGPGSFKVSSHLCGGSQPGVGGYFTLVWGRGQAFSRLLHTCVGTVGRLELWQGRALVGF